MRHRTVLALIATIIVLTGPTEALALQGDPLARMTPFPHGGLGYGQFKEEPSDKPGYRKFTAALDRLSIFGTVISIEPSTSGFQAGEPKVPYMGVYLGKYCWFFHRQDFSFKNRDGAPRSVVYVPIDIAVPPVFLALKSPDPS